jgi:protein ImuB
VLWACLYFADLPLRVFARAAVEKNPTVVSSASHRPDVIAANAAAKRSGIVPGLSIAAALALVPELSIHVRDPCGEDNALRGIALWANQWTSTISIEPPAGLLLELSACLDYFGGLRTLVDRIDTGVFALGFSALIAIAPTAGAASLFARAGRRIAVESQQHLNAQLESIPISLMAGAQDALATLGGIGVHTLGELMALPRDGLARRFGQRLLDDIDRACAQLPDPRPLFAIPERYHGQIELPAPVEEVEALLFAVKRLVVELAGFLQGRGAGVTRLRCDLVHEDMAPTSIVIGLAATRQVDHMLNVLRERLSREQLPDRVEAIRLVSEEIRSLSAKETDFFPTSKRSAESDEQLVERLRARLGEDAVQTLGLHADHRPEQAWRYRNDITARATTVAMDSPLRPLWLLPEPKPMDGEPSIVDLKLLSGPERIETGWWDADEIGRDYFVGRNAEGEAVWLYRDRDGKWFVHGVFS